MKQEALSYFTETYLTQIAMVLFFLSFLGVVCKALKKSNNKYFDEMSQLPLAKENGNE